MNKNKLDLVCDSIIMNGPLLDEFTLYNSGITKSEETIEELLKEGLIEKVGYNKYKLTSVELLYNYGLELLRDRHYLKANECFERCYHIDPTHRDTCLQIFLLNIQAKKYSNAYEILDKLLSINSSEYKEDNNLFLYLISIISECPKKYREQIKKMELKDVLIPVDRKDYNNIEEANGVRESIMRHRLTFAMREYNDKLAHNLKYSISKEVIKELLSQAQREVKNIQSQLLKLTKDKDYQSIKEILEHIKETRQSNAYYDSIYELTVAILEIQKTKIIPQITIVNTKRSDEAIEGKNYELALELNNEYLVSPNKRKDNIIHLLLVEINQLIKELKQEEPVEKDIIRIPTQSRTSKRKNKNRISKNNSDFSTVMIPQKVVTPPLYFNKENNSYLLTSNKKTISDRELKNYEEIAYFIKEENLLLENSIKKMGLLSETILIVKLIYARDYYIEENYENGDKLLQEVELSLNITERVKNLLIQIKNNRNNYKNQKTKHTRKLSLS